MSELYYQTEVVATLDQIAIKDGRMFRAYYNFSVDPLSSKYVLIRTPVDKFVIFHGRYVNVVGSNLNMIVYSNPVFSSQGVENTKKFNLNSNSANQTTGMFWSDPVFSSKGVETDRTILSGGVQAHVTSGSQDVADFERILPDDIYFLVEFQNTDNTNTANVVYKLTWEEIIKP